MKRTILKLVGAEDSAIQEAYKVLRTNLQFCGTGIQVLAVTSCAAQEGKTTVVLNLAKNLAQLGKRVLVLDADLRHSVLACQNTTAGNAQGLSEVLNGMVNLGDCIYCTQYAGLELLFAGNPPPNPVELLSGPHFAAILTECRKYYDYVLVDTPPLGEVIDAAVIAPHGDGTLLVMLDGKVRCRTAQQVVAQLKKSGGKILGVVQNHLPRTDRAAGKGNARAR